MPVFTLQSPDGRTIKIEAADQATALRGAQEWSSQSPLKPQAAKRGVVSEVAGALANVNRGLGIGDEVAAGLKTAGDMIAGKIGPEGDRTGFKRNMAEQRALEDDFSQRRPLAAAAARGVGNAAVAAVPAGQTANVLAMAPRGLNLATGLNAARGAALAGVQGSAYAAADRGSGAERLKAASKAVVDPLTLGLGAAGGVAGMSRAPKVKASPGRSLDELQQAKNAAYAAVDQSGVRYTPAAVDKLLSDMTMVTTRAKLNPLRHPKAASMLEEMQSIKGTAPTLTELDQLRQVINRDVTGSTDKAEKFFGRQMVDQIDKFIEQSGPAALQAGSGADADALIKNARLLNGKVRKVEAVEGAVEKARNRAGSTGSGGNIDNAIRQNLRSVMEKTPGLTTEEKDALQTVVLGGKGQNALRSVGKLSPTSGGLMAAGNLAAAATSGGLGALPGAVGLGAKYAADAITRNNVKDLLRVISSDAATQAQLTAAQRQIAALPKGPAAAGLQRAVAARLARVAGVLGGSRAGDAERTTNVLAPANSGR